MKTDDIRVGGIYRVRPGHEAVCSQFCRKNGEFVEITNINNRFLTYNVLDKNKEFVGSSYMFEAHNLIPTNDIRHPYVGMILENICGCKYMVLAVTGKIVILSHLDEFNVADSTIWTVEELIEYGFKVVGADQKEDEKVELTMDEIANKFGIDVKKLKIKKEE